MTMIRSVISEHTIRRMMKGSSFKIRVGIHALLLGTVLAMQDDCKEDAEADGTSPQWSPNVIHDYIGKVTEGTLKQAPAATTEAGPVYRVFGGDPMEDGEQFGPPRMIIFRHSDGLHEKLFQKGAGWRGQLGQTTHGDYFLSYMGLRRASAAERLRKEIRTLYVNDNKDDIIFQCSPLSRPLQTFVGALLPLLEELDWNIEVQIHRGLRERHMEGDSSVFNFLHKYKCTWQEKIEILKWRHIRALDRYYPNWHRLITIKYEDMDNAFSNRWVTNYTQRKRDPTRGKKRVFKVEDKGQYMNNVNCFLDDMKVHKTEIIVAACHGGTCRFIMNSLKIPGEGKDGLIDLESFHIKNVDAFCLREHNGTWSYTKVKGPTGSEVSCYEMAGKKNKTDEDRFRRWLNGEDGKIAESEKGHVAMHWLRTVYEPIHNMSKEQYLAMCRSQMKAREERLNKTMREQKAQGQQADQPRTRTTTPSPPPNK